MPKAESMKDPKSLRFATVAVDVPVFSYLGGELLVLTQTINRPPHYVNVPAFMGGVIDANETADEAVERHLSAKAGLENVYTEQLYTFSAVDRDKRNRVISVSYLGLVQPKIVENYEFTNCEWLAVSAIDSLAYDHTEMLRVAIARLQARFAYTNIAQHILPTHFTLTELQTVYEDVLNTTFDKRNFRKKILQLDLIKDTGRMQEGVKNRPAKLYTFAKRVVHELPLFA